MPEGMGHLEFSLGYWPDLTLVRDGEASFIEVCTTKPLDVSQLEYMPEWRDLLTAKFSVVRLRSLT